MENSERNTLKAIQPVEFAGQEKRKIYTTWELREELNVALTLTTLLLGLGFVALAIIVLS